MLLPGNRKEMDWPTDGLLYHVSTLLLHRCPRDHAWDKWQQPWKIRTEKRRGRGCTGLLSLWHLLVVSTPLVKALESVAPFQNPQGFLSTNSLSFGTSSSKSGKTSQSNNIVIGFPHLQTETLSHSLFQPDSLAVFGFVWLQKEKTAFWATWINSIIRQYALWSNQLVPFTPDFTGINITQQTISENWLILLALQRLIFLGNDERWHVPRRISH